MNPILISSILSGLLQSSLLVGTAWLLTLAQRRTSAARRSTGYRLTMAAAIALVVIVVGNAALSIVPSHINGDISAQAALPQGPGTIAENFLLHLSGSPVLKTNEPVTAIPLTNARRNLSLPLSAGSARWLTAGWLMGAALVVLIWIRSLVARQFLLHHSVNATGMPWLKNAGKIKGWPLVDQVRLFPQEITPCVWGVFKTILVLPSSASSWPSAKLQLVLAHESAHLLRRDPFWQMLSRLFVAMLWFHPLAWNLARRSQAADEQAADDNVLQAECDGPAYAGLLVECARQFSFPPALQATASAMASPTTLTRRVEAVLNPGADRRPANFAWLLSWAAIISLVTAVSSFAAPEVTTAPEQEKTELFPAEQATKVTNDAPETQPPQKNPAPPSTAPAPLEPAPGADKPTVPPSDPPAAETIDTPLTENFSKGAFKRGPFEWKIMKIDGFDYVGVDQIKTFYSFPRLSTEDSGSFTLRSQTIVITGTIGSKELSVNKVRFFLQLPVGKSKENSEPMISRQDLAGLLEPIIRPAYIQGNTQFTTVVIDPGHGGHDSGASSPQGKESVYTLDTAQRVARKLAESGIKAVLTRNEDRFMPLDERVIFAAKQPEAILISLHFNSNRDATQQGIQTFYQESPASDRLSVALATAVHANTLYKTRSTDGGISAGKFSVLAGYRKAPGILIECGYLTNPAEATRIAYEDYRQSIAEAIAGGVRNYLKATRSKTKPGEALPPVK